MACSRTSKIAGRLKMSRQMLRHAGNISAPVQWHYICGAQQFAVRHYRTTSVLAKQEELFPQRLTLPENRGYVPMLSPAQVTSILATNEASMTNSVNQRSAVRSFDSNQLPSNSPIEDRRAVARILQSNAVLFGVFDGHGGAACAQAVSERLFEYLAVALMPFDLLEKYSHTMRTDHPMPILEQHQFRGDYNSEDLMHLYHQSLQKFVSETLSCSSLEESESTIIDKIKSAVIRLDNDISAEAMPVGGAINDDLLSVAMSGACACTVHIEDLDLHVTNLGDCRAIIGSIDPNGNWTARALTDDHNIENQHEADRVRSEHPKNEANLVFKNDRLLGHLIPLRAFGDVRFKWSVKDLNAVIKIMNSPYAHSLIPMHYHTPPYLNNRPQVRHHRLSKRERFLVIASDGLWETMSNEKVVEVVGDHLTGKQTLERFSWDHYGARTLGDISKVLRDRKRGLAHKSTDENGATHLIRHALGFDHRKVSEMLTFPSSVSRHYRDDITVIIVYFDEDYMEKNCDAK